MTRSGARRNSDETMTWVKSSFSTGSANCVEVADPRTGAAVRDSKNACLGHLTFGNAEWSAFVEAVKTTGF